MIGSPRPSTAATPTAPTTSSSTAASSTSSRPRPTASATSTTRRSTTPSRCYPRRRKRSLWDLCPLREIRSHLDEQLLELFLRHGRRALGHQIAALLRFRERD